MDILWPMQASAASNKEVPVSDDMIYRQWLSGNRMEFIGALSVEAADDCRNDC